MTITEIIIVFVMTWWVVLFMALPIGVQQARNVEVGHDDGAPENIRLPIKLLATTVITCVLTLVFYYVKTHYDFGIFELRP